MSRLWVCVIAAASVGAGFAAGELTGRWRRVAEGPPAGEVLSLSVRHDPDHKHPRSCRSLTSRGHVRATVTVRDREEADAVADYLFRVAERVRFPAGGEDVQP